MPRGIWAAPGPAGPRPLLAPELFAALARRQVVLLGETHDDAEDHRWQLQTIAGLHALRPDMVLGFEMFPRRVQPALDRWVAGELDEAEFLRESDWRQVWNVDPRLYMPIFHFARMNRVPMIALNVSQDLVRAVRERGFDALPLDRREGVTPPLAASPGYLDFLSDAYVAHARGDGSAAKDGKRPPMREDAAFQRFVESQLVWDRAMAEALAAALKRVPAPLVVGVLGSGHVWHGYGVPHQLRDLGVADTAVLLPWGPERECSTLVAGVANAVFGVAAPERLAPRSRQRLGVWLEPDEGGVRIRQIEQGSVAESAGMRAGDVVTEVAGLPARQPADLAEAVQRQAPGTWLPLRVRRGAESLELIAKFPPAEPPRK